MERPKLKKRFMMDDAEGRTGCSTNAVKLGCVVLPILASDLRENLPTLLKVWAHPFFFPRLTNDAPRPHLLLVVNNATEDELEKCIAFVDDFPEVKACFSGVSAKSAELSGDMDLYTKRRDLQKGAYGTRAGPNFLFHAGMKMAAEFGGFALQIELDCLPVQAGWLELTQEVIDGHQRAWVIGSHYGGDGELRSDIQEHLNGNALYKTGSRHFQRFVAQVWMPRLLEHVRGKHELAYDCWWALEKSQARALPPNEGWEIFKTFSGFIQSDPFIVNLTVPVDQARDYISVFEKFIQLERQPVFMHGQAMVPVRGLVAENHRLNIFDAIDRLSPPQEERGPLPELQAAMLGDEDVAGEIMPSLLAMGREWNAEARANARLLLTQVRNEFEKHPESAGYCLKAPHPLAKAISDAQTLLGAEHPACVEFNFLPFDADLSDS